MRPTSWMLAVAALGACGGSDPVGPSCLDPARGKPLNRFADVTGDSGVEFTYSAKGFQGGGLAVADLDGDGLPEIVAGRRTGGVALFRNLGARRFTAIVDSGIEVAPAATAIGAADLDNDGDTDLVIASENVAYVLANQGDGTFREAARFADSGTTEHVLPTDLDGDGDLDLYFSNYDLRSAAATQNRLYLNQGGLAFTAAAVPGRGLTWTTSAFDIDADGDQDLYVANDTLLPDFGRPETNVTTSPLPVDLVLRNSGPGPDGVPQLTDVAAAVGLAKPRSSMGGLVADFDDDGRLDIFVTDFGAKKLFLADGGGGFVESAVRLGLDATFRHSERCDPLSETEDCLVLSWSAALSDFDLDGYDEVLIVSGETSPQDSPPVLAFTRGPELPYREVSPEIPCMDARGLAVTDLDADGDQDVVIAQKEGPLVIYENLGRPERDRWLGVELRGRASNADGIGAVVTARMTSGRTLIRAIGAGGMIHTATPAEAHFGLGTDVVDRLEVQWPSGRRTEIMRPDTGLIVLDEGP